MSEHELINYWVFITATAMLCWTFFCGVVDNSEWLPFGILIILFWPITLPLGCLFLMLVFIYRLGKSLAKTKGE
jgi:hypothetical protein